MKVLLVHPLDEIPASCASVAPDLIVDLARAPEASYQFWTERLGCSVISLHDFREPIEDLHSAKRVLDLDRNHLVDDQGIDWWSLASYLVVDGLLQSFLLLRLAKKIGAPAELFCTRPDARAEALRVLLGTKLVYLGSSQSSIGQKLKHYRNVFSRLDRTQIAQIIADKWDPQHQIRRRCRKKGEDGHEQAILLPSAYINISRTAIAYARLLPEQHFLLVHARSSGKLSQLPPNVQSLPLHPYYKKGAPEDLGELLRGWEALQRQLTSNSEAMHQAEQLGAMRSIPAFIERGVSARDAWKSVFESHNVVGCLSADDTNVYTRVPLVLAERRGLASVACHHGALDFRMAVKNLHGNAYLAKSEMEKDYLENICRMAPEKITVGGPASPIVVHSRRDAERPWLVFFTEPYDADEWRIAEVYRDLLPMLLGLSRECRLRLVLKLHPFESVKSHRNLHAAYLPPQQLHDFDIVAVPFSEDSWNRIRFAVTVQSSVALECTQRGIRVFLFRWLQMRYGGYLDQFARFGAGCVLDLPQDLESIPERLATYKVGGDLEKTLGTAISPGALQRFLSSQRLDEIHSKTRRV
jgi:hypothetical protein